MPVPRSAPSAAEAISDPTRWRGNSLWFDSLPEPVVARDRLASDLEVDIAVVGAGYTGLWTAYYLSGIDPHLRIAVLEQEVAGFGASGRNGGWCSAFFAASPERLARHEGKEAMHRLRRALQESVDEVGAVASAEGIDCHYRKGGSISLARSPAQLARAKAEIESLRRLGIGDNDVRWCEPAEAKALVAARDVLGGVHTPHCAAVHPARLVRGLAVAAERRGVRIFEQTPVRRISPAGPSGRLGRLETPGCRVRAEVVVLATEGYTPLLPGNERRVLPLYSLMVATEPLEDDVLESLGELRQRHDNGPGGQEPGSSANGTEVHAGRTGGLRGGLTFTDGRHLLIYGQLTADGRLAFGGRGAPYHFGSRVADSFDQVPAVHRALRETLGQLFPSLGDVRLTHTWGGPLGVHRDWRPSVVFDRSAGLATAGGYVGDGVGTANLAGRTLGDLISGRQSDVSTLCWVGHRSPEWECEPLRWAGVNAGLTLMHRADLHEQATGRPSRIADLMGRFIGH